MDIVKKVINFIKISGTNDSSQVVNRSVHLQSLNIILYFSVRQKGSTYIQSCLSWKLKMFISYNLQITKCQFSNFSDIYLPNKEMFARQILTYIGTFLYIDDVVSNRLIELDTKSFCLLLKCKVMELKV